MKTLDIFRSLSPGELEKATPISEEVIQEAVLEGIRNREQLEKS